MRRSAGVLALLLLAATAVACGGSASHPTAPLPPAAAASGASTTVSPSVAPSVSPSPVVTAPWPTYHHGNARTGVVSGFPRPHTLSTAWSTGLDGAVYGQPLVVGSTVIAATEHNTVYGLDLASGRVRWHNPLGTPVPLANLPCGNIDPLGITGTPAYDASTGSVFVVTETTGAHHTLVALDARTGTKRWARSLDVLSTRDRHAEQQRGALAVVNGRVYVPFGGLAGDCGNYVGYVAAVSTDGTGSVATYAVPTPREGGIWAPSGVAIRSDGAVYVAAGNGARFQGPYDGSDSVLRLSKDLSRRLSYFAPTSWGDQNAGDVDLGSTGPLLLGTNRALVSGKDGNVYLLDSSSLGGIGGQLATVGGCRGFGGLAYDPAQRAAFVPCTTGVLRVEVRSTSLSRGWQADGSINGSPVLGGGAVWALDTGSGVLHALDESTGRSIVSRSVGSVSRFASPVLANGTVLVGTLSGVVAVAVR